MERRSDKSWGKSKEEGVVGRRKKMKGSMRQIHPFTLPQEETKDGYWEGVSTQLI